MDQNYVPAEFVVKGFLPKGLTVLGGAPKIAVELAIHNHMLGAGYVALTDEEMRYIRNACTNMVRNLFAR